MGASNRGRRLTTLTAFLAIVVLVTAVVAAVMGNFFVCAVLVIGLLVTGIRFRRNSLR